MKRTEIILIILSIIALGFNLLLIPGGGVLTVLTLSALSFIYFYLSFALFNNIRLRKIFKKDSYKQISLLRILGAIGTGIALSFITIGLMFKFQSWEGADFNLSFGLIGIFIVIVIGFIRYSKTKSDYYKRIFKRIAIFGGLGLILFLTPRTRLIDFKYRNQPDYADALKKSIADPDNKEVWDKVEVERKKMNGE